MAEHPERPDIDESELERERQESTDLGYRDTEEERAYERAEPAPPKESVPPGTEDESAVGGG